MAFHTSYNHQGSSKHGTSGLPFPPPPPPAVTPDTPAAVTMNSLSSSFSRLHVMDNPPPENPRIEDVEKLAATEMNQLSMESREQILYDLHGIAEKMPEETPEFLQTKLRELEAALDQIDPSEKEAYEMALSIDPDYVKNREFRLKFLRADLFSAPESAVRFTKHFQAKLELFGKHLLCKDITQDDCEDDEGTLECICSGWLQDLPIRDISGRLVSFMFQNSRDPRWTAEAKCRAIWYRRMINSNDIETQRNGKVLIIITAEKEPDRNSVWKAGEFLVYWVLGESCRYCSPGLTLFWTLVLVCYSGRLAGCLPLRFVAFHMCYLPEYYEKQGPALSLGRIAMDSYQRHRYRTHTGSMTELKYILQTFGIPMSALPIDDSGVVPHHYNQELMMKQRLLERRLAASPVTITTEEVYDTDTTDASFQQEQRTVRTMTPGTHDVLMGRGRSCQEHPGYVFMFSVRNILFCEAVFDPSCLPRVANSVIIGM